MNYAKIQDGVILDIQVANVDDIFDPSFVWVDLTGVTPCPQIGWTTLDNISFVQPGLSNDAYGNIVTLSSGGGMDTYTSGGMIFKVPAGTPLTAIYLKMAIGHNLALFMDAADQWGQNKYSLSTRFNMLSIYNAAVTAGLSNRAAYVFQLMAWNVSVMAYIASYVASVKAMTNPATVAATIFDPSQISLPDPLVNAVYAMGISN